MYQVLINNQPLRPTSGEPYIFNTYEEAYKNVCLFYGQESLKTFAKIVKL